MICVQFLLNKMNRGELPMAELSRDNLRDFIDFNLGINLKWDRVSDEVFLVVCCLVVIVVFQSQFDSICQRIDIEKKGFVSTASVLRAFQQMVPLVDKTQSVSQAVFVDLMTLTLSIQGFAERKQEITHTFLNLISENASSSPSFSKFMTKEKDSFSASKFALLTGTGAARTASGNGGAVTDVKILEEQLFVSDVLFELSRDVVGEMHMSSHIDWKAVGNTSEFCLDS